MPLSYPLASPPLSFLEKAGWPLNLLRFKKEDFCLTFCKYLSSHGQKNGKDVKSSADWNNYSTKILFYKS